jgi:benzoate membrane transport protein
MESRAFLRGFYFILALVGVALVKGFAALPSSIIITIAGLALLGPLLAALHAALEPENTRFAAVLTLVATASSMTLFGIGSAFWGLMLGLSALGLEHIYKKVKR